MWNNKLIEKIFILTMQYGNYYQWSTQRRIRYGDPCPPPSVMLKLKKTHFLENLKPIIYYQGSIF